MGEVEPTVLREALDSGFDEEEQNALNRTVAFLMPADFI